MPVARILFPLPLPEPFDYAVPEGLDVVEGSYVKAPLGKTERIGVVLEILPDDVAKDRDLKSVISVFPVAPMTRATRKFIQWGARYTVSHPGHMLAMSLRARGGLQPSPTETRYSLTGETPPRLTDARRKLLESAAAMGPATASRLAEAAGVSAGVAKGLVKAGALRAEQTKIDLPFDTPVPGQGDVTLTSEQAEASADLRAAVATGAFETFLLDGVTGSGKTEVYFEAIDAALKKDPDAQVLVLLPEIALTQAILRRFTDRFSATPARWHSGLSERERRRTWREVANGHARIVLGARSALFLPFQSLKLIVIDEEHDTSFKQEDGVRYHARDLGVVRAKLEDAVIVLASATPALETVVNAEQGRFQRLKLAARPGAARLPEIDLVDMRTAPPGKGLWLSPVLVGEMQQTLEAGEQTLLFLNRRGYAPLVICKSCGQRLKSPGTENWLVEHRYSRRLVCHLTGFSMTKPTHCPECGAEDSLMGVGPGVERVAEEVRTLLPEARIEIFSSDTAQSGDDIRGMVQRMTDGEIDVLIGTQIVAKGHNFPNLTLVGVVDADSGMKGGDLRAGERTFQLLSQVAGRAGRAERPGRALIQTYAPENPAMIALEHQDRDGFLQIERDVRAELGLPPFGRLAAIIMSAPSEAMVGEEARRVVAAAPNGEGIEVYGPAPAPISVIRGRHRRRFLIKSPRSVDLSAYMSAWISEVKLPSSVRLSVDIDPYSFL